MCSAILSIRGIDARVVTGETNANTRRRHIDAYKSPTNKPIVLCNFGVLTTGFDAPHTSAAIIGRPTRSLVLYSQMVGRATRGPKAGGNSQCEISTVVDISLPGFGSMEQAFTNWEDVWND
jgi:superfamily II DNA or RNA helicase